MGTRKEFRKQSILSVCTGEKFRHEAPATEIYNGIKLTKLSKEGALHCCPE